jgi:hypothetical protein
VRVTLDEYAGLPDQPGHLDELIAGEVIYRPFAGARTGIAGGNAGFALSAHRQTHGGCATARCGLVLARDPDTVVCADALYWPNREAVRATSVRDWPTVPPLAAFVIVNEFESEQARERRVRLLIGFGIGVLWVVDPFADAVTEYRRGGARTLEADATLDGGDVLPGFTCKVADLFA